jgi:cell division septation protein DedD
LPTKDESEAATKDDGSPAASRDDATTKPEKSVESAAKPTTAEASAEPAAKPTAGDPPADPEAPTGPYTRNYLILSQVPGGLESELSLILGDHVDWSNVKVIPARNRPINRKPPMDPLCGSAAKYRHPESMVPFSSVESFKTIEAVLAGRYIWDAAGWWAGGEADAFAEGIEEIEGWREASCRGWLGGKEVEEAVEEEPIGVETLEAVEEDPVEEEPEPEPEPPAPAPAPKRPRKSTSRASTSQKRKATSEPAEEPEEEKKPAKKSRSSKSKRRR